MDDVAAHGVALDGLHQSQFLLLAVVDVHNRVGAVFDDQKDVVTGDIQVNRIHSVAVHNRGDVAGTARAARRALAKFGALNAGDAEFYCCHFFS